MNLTELTINQVGYISVLPDDLELTRLLMEQGFNLHTKIVLSNRGPFGGPLAFKLHNTKLVLTKKIAKQIRVVLELVIIEDH